MCLFLDYTDACQDVRGSATYSIFIPPHPKQVRLMAGYNRLMSDYEVTLVNDNSKSATIFLFFLSRDLSSHGTLELMDKQCMSRPARGDRRYRILDLSWIRQEFYVRFKGPEESTYRFLPYLRTIY